MTNIDKALEAARRVERARAELAAAERELLSLTSGPPKPTPAKARPAEPAGKPSVSQRVLRMVIDAGPGGVPRKDIVAVVGKARETAVHSALKQHQNKGRVANEDGRWVATAALVRELQSPGARQ